MNTEKQNTEYKSLQKIRTGDKGFKELSVTCVALANAQGGMLFIIAERIPDVELKEIRKMVYAMVGKEIIKEGSRSNCIYLLK